MQEHSAGRQPLSWPPTFILYTGGYRAYKNLDLLLRAYARACSLRPKMSPLLLTGNIRSASDISGLTPEAQGVFDSCRESGKLLLPGRLSEQDLPLLYSAARLFVSASLHEGFGFPPLEAMHRGCPVLVADHTAFREVLPKPECRFDPDDFDTFVDKLILADESPERFYCPPNPEHAFSAGLRRFEAFLNTLA